MFKGEECSFAPFHKEFCVLRCIHSVLAGTPFCTEQAGFLHTLK